MIGAPGDLYTKQDDLHVHASSRQVVTLVDGRDLRHVLANSTPTSVFTGQLQGTLDSTLHGPYALYPRLAP